MQGGDHLEVQLGHDLSGHQSGRRKGDGIVNMQDLQLLDLRHLSHLGGKRQRVREILEQRVLDNVHLVETDAGRQTSQTQRRRIADERDLVPVLDQVLAQLGCHHAASPVRWIARNANPHNAFLRAQNEMNLAARGSSTSNVPRTKKPSPYCF